MKPLNNNYCYYKRYDIAKMNPAMSTALQSWSRPKLVSVGVLLFLLHLGVFLMGVALAPSMFHDAQVRPFYESFL